MYIVGYADLLQLARLVVTHSIQCVISRWLYMRTYMYTHVSMCQFSVALNSNTH
jgi:hypothetical protein